MRIPSFSEFRSLFKENRVQPYDEGAIFGDWGIPVNDDFETLTDFYRKHVWVYAAVYAISSNISSLKFRVARQLKDGTLEDNPRNPFFKILENPNPHMTGVFLKEFTSASLELMGNAYWGIERDPNGVPVELWPLPAHMMRVVASDKNMVDHYVYSPPSRPGSPVRYDSNDVFHFKYTNPDNLVYGHGSMRSALISATTDLYAQLWNRNFFRNSARPDAIITSTTAIDTTNRNLVLKGFRQMFSGPANARKVAFLPMGMKYEPVDSKHSDMEFLSGRKMSREEVLTAFGVPPAMAGILENANYSNSEVQERIFWKHTLLPKVRSLSATMTKRVQQVTYLTDCVVELDVSKVDALREDEKAKAETAKVYSDIGVPFKIINDRLGLGFPEFQDWDKPRPVPTIGLPAASPPKPPVSEEDSDEEKRAKEAGLRKQTKAALSRDQKWKKFDRKTSTLEARMLGSVRTYFRGQKKRVLSALKDSADSMLGAHIPKSSPRGRPTAKAPGDVTISVEPIFDRENERRIMDGAVRKRVRDAYFDFAVSAGRAVDPSFDFNLKDPAARAWIDSKVFQLVQEVNDHTLEEISDSVREAVEEAVREGYSRSETIAQIVDRIDDVYDFAMKGRAERIARTEVISASNAGALDGMKGAGAEKKEWVASRDSKVRDSHQEADGEVVGISEPFVVGKSSLSFPGDPSGEPEETINCRCAVVPVVE